jgi:hypothetical protein
MPEVFNVLDRNLGVQAYIGQPLPRQELPYDLNDGSAFWWANNLNTFTRNVAVECDRWGFRFEAAPTPGFDLRRPVPQPDGRVETVDIRTLPFVRFDGNEAHDQLTGINLGGAPGDPFEPGVGGVWPSPGEALFLRNTRMWNTQWAVAPHTRYTLHNLDIADSSYGLFMPAHSAIIWPRKDPQWGRLVGQGSEGGGQGEGTAEDRAQWLNILNHGPFATRGEFATRRGGRGKLGSRLQVALAHGHALRDAGEFATLLGVKGCR